MNYKCITNEPSGGVEGGTAQDCQTRSINHRSNKTVGSVLSFEGEKRLQGGKFHARGRVAHTITHVDIRGDFRVRGCVSLRVVCCAALWGYNLDMNQPSVRFYLSHLIFLLLFFFFCLSRWMAMVVSVWWTMFPRRKKTLAWRLWGFLWGFLWLFFGVGSFVSELLQQRVHRTVLCERKADDAMSQLLAPAFKATLQSWRLPSRSRKSVPERHRMFILQLFDSSLHVAHAAF